MGEEAAPVTKKEFVQQIGTLNSMRLAVDVHISSHCVKSICSIALYRMDT
jgi:hypothetical protein